MDNYEVARSGLFFFGYFLRPTISRGKQPVAVGAGLQAGADLRGMPNLRNLRNLRETDPELSRTHDCRGFYVLITLPHIRGASFSLLS
jgi:hypothetical protein